MLVRIVMVMEKSTNRQSNYKEILCRILIGAIRGKNAHLSINKALDGLKLDISGKKVINTPYTIWQLLTHLNYWQVKFLQKLEGREVSFSINWEDGWEESLNAANQEILDRKIINLLGSIEKATDILLSECDKIEPHKYYQDKFDVLQAMASHISYHLGELIILRRMFGEWNAPTVGFYGSFKI